MRKKYKHINQYRSESFYTLHHLIPILLQEFLVELLRKIFTFCTSYYVTT